MEDENYEHDNDCECTNCSNERRESDDARYQEMEEHPDKEDFVRKALFGR